MTITELTQGFHREQNMWHCNYCEVKVRIDQRAQIVEHLTIAHQSALDALLAAGGLTENQQQLMQAFAAGHSDKQIAADQGVTASTIRQQKYRFRQKAAQSRLFLAQYQAVFGENDPVELLSVPKPAQNMAITVDQYEQVLAKNIDFSSAHPKLKHWPKPEAARVCLCARIVEDFAIDRQYTLNETNAILDAWYPDHSLLARYLVDFSFMQRTADGRQYWRIF
jgi:DNA-binding CsgD family transcriptional regulator